ncbi:MAG: hypothetical protein RR837_10975, partial [Bacteroidales bacterium]
FKIEICSGIVNCILSKPTTDMMIEYSGSGIFGQPYIQVHTEDNISSGNTVFGYTSVGNYTYPYYAQRRATIINNSILQVERRIICTQKKEVINELIDNKASLIGRKFVKISFNSNYPAFPNGTKIKIYDYDTSNN